MNEAIISPDCVLAVDLDGTLCRTDTLIEAMLSLAKRRPLKLFLLPFWLFKGKAGFKAEVARHAGLDVTTLAYNDELVNWLRAEQADGRRIALAMRRLAYGETVATGPRATAARRSGDRTTVTFADVSGALAAYNGPPNAFELCDGTACRWASAHLAGNSVVLDGTAAKVCYCWGDTPVCTLTDNSALPAGPFELPVQ